MDPVTIISFEFDKICRLCLSHSGSMSYIFNELLISKIAAFTSLRMHPGDGLPTLICLRCLQLVEQSFNFKKQCESSDQFLKQYISKQHLVCTPMNTNNIKDSKPEHKNLLLNGDIGKDITTLGALGSSYPMQLMLNNTFVEPIVMVVNPDDSDYESPTEDNIKASSKGQHGDRFIKNSQPGSSANTRATSETQTEPKNVLGMYGCTFCNKSFADSSCLTAHVRLHQVAAKPFDCKTCGETFSTFKDLRQHEHSHVEPRAFVCPVCSKAFSRSTNLSKHARIHTGVRPFACDQCPKTFQARGDLARHKLVHSGIKPFSCELCTLSFSRKDKLNRHMKTHEPQNSSPLDHLGEFATLVENYNAKQNQLLAQSKLNELNPSAPEQLKPNKPSSNNYFHCNTCYEIFTDIDTLKEHQKTHSGPNKHLCGTCGKEFNRWRELFRHEQIHTGERPFECGQCGKRFSRKDKLLRHTRVHSDRKPFKCSECPSNFEQQDDLTRHQQNHSHTPESRWTCRTCFKAFPTRLEMTKHINDMHAKSKPKPFKCPHCKVSFYKKDKFNRHVRSHTVKRLTCNLCTFSCLKKAFFEKHMKTHEPVPEATNVNEVKPDPVSHESNNEMFFKESLETQSEASSDIPKVEPKPEEIKVDVKEEITEPCEDLLMDFKPEPPPKESYEMNHTS